MAQSSLGPQCLTIKMDPVWSDPGSTSTHLAMTKLKVDLLDDGKPVSICCRDSKDLFKK